MLDVIEQRYTVNAPPEAVIAGLSDAAVLRAAIPRCKDLRRLSDTKFWVLTEIGILRWTFQVEGIVTLAFDGLQIHIGSDVRTKAFRLGRADTILTLTPAPDKTVITSKTTLLAARTHSRLGQHAAVAVAKRLLDSFFTNFKPPLTT